MKLTITILCLALLSSGSLFAQVSNPDMAKSFSKESVSKQDMRKYNLVRPKVKKLNKEFRKKLKNATASAEASDIQEKYRKKMIETISEAGLSLDKYNQIQIKGNR